MKVALRGNEGGLKDFQEWFGWQDWYPQYTQCTQAVTRNHLSYFFTDFSSSWHPSNHHTLHIIYVTENQTIDQARFADCIFNESIFPSYLQHLNTNDKFSFYHHRYNKNLSITELGPFSEGESESKLMQTISLHNGKSTQHQVHNKPNPLKRQITLPPIPPKRTKSSNPTNQYQTDTNDTTTNKNQTKTTIIKIPIPNNQNTTPINNNNEQNTLTQPPNQTTHSHTPDQTTTNTSKTKTLPYLKYPPQIYLLSFT